MTTAEKEELTAKAKAALAKKDQPREKPEISFPPAGPNDLMKGDPIASWNPRAIAGEEQYIEDARKAGTALDGSDFHSISAGLALKNLLRRDNEKPPGPISQNRRPEPLAQLASEQILPGMIPAGGNLQGPANPEFTSLPALVPEPEGDPTAEMSVVDRLKRIQASNRDAMPQQPPINPEATAIEGQLAGMKPPPQDTGLKGMIGRGLEGFARYGWMDPAKAQTLESSRQQTGVENQRNKQQDLLAQLKQIQDRDRQATMDARQRGLDERDAAYQDVQSKGIQSQIDDHGKPKFGNAAGIGIYNEGTGEVTTPARPPLGPQPQPAMSPERFEQQRKLQRPPAPTNSDYEWVTRDGQPMQIRKGSAQAGDTPYNRGDVERPQGELSGLAQAALRDPTILRGLTPTNRGAIYDELGKSGMVPPSQFLNVINRTIDTLDKLGTAKGKSGAVGAKGPASLFGALDRPVAGTSAGDYRKLIDQAKANLTLPELELMRGLGHMSDAEFNTITNAATTLSQDLSEEAFEAERQRVREAVEKVRLRLSGGQIPHPPPEGGGSNVQRLKRTSKRTGAVEFSEDGGATWHK